MVESQIIIGVESALKAQKAKANGFTVTTDLSKNMCYLVGVEFNSKSLTCNFPKLFSRI